MNVTNASARLPIRSSRQLPFRHALTLLELLVVLIILAVVATVAVNSLQPRIDSARLQQTRNQIENIRTATIGSRGSRQTDGTPLISGFLSDVGRLPRPTSNGSPRPTSNGLTNRDKSMELRELWDPETVLARDYPFRFRSGPTTPIDYSQIQIPCGWRGPYLHLGLGSSNVTDSWGRAFDFEYGDDSTIESLLWRPVEDSGTEMRCGLKCGKVIVTGTLNFGQSAPSDVEVVLLGPDPDSSLSELAVFADEDSNPFTFVFTDVAVGLRAIQVRYDGKQLTRYIHVAHQGLTMALEFADSSE